MVGYRRVCVLVVVAVCWSMVLAPGASADKDDTVLVSRATGAGAAGDFNSGAPSISADGRFIAFQSFAKNIDDDEDENVFDIFVRDMQSFTNTLVSRASGVGGDAGDGDSFNPSISADGLFVAFESNADNLGGDSMVGVSDIFIRDLTANTTTLVSRATNGDVADNHSASPAISADGRFVAFRSAADNLDDAADHPVNQHIFVRDLADGTTTLVSRATGPDGEAGDATSDAPSISADGRRIAFHSSATNLVPEASNGTGQVYVRDVVSNTTTLVSRRPGPAGARGNATSSFPSISADGRRVAFASDAGNLDTLSNDAVTDVFVRDLAAHTTTLVSRANGANGQPGNGDSGFLSVSISADGRRVAFGSDAQNLDGESDDAVTDVFVRDLVSNTTTLVSRGSGPDGVVGDDASGSPASSVDGRFVAFTSEADLGDAAVITPRQHVFVRDVLGPQPASSVRINDVSRKEGDKGRRRFVFTVRVVPTSAVTVTVDFATADGTAKVKDKDYVPQIGSLTFLPGETSKRVAVLVRGDRRVERNERFKVLLANSTGAPLGDGIGIGIIRNDD